MDMDLGAEALISSVYSVGLAVVVRCVSLAQQPVEGPSRGSLRVYLLCPVLSCAARYLLLAPMLLGQLPPICYPPHLQPQPGIP